MRRHPLRLFEAALLACLLFSGCSLFDDSHQVDPVKPDKVQPLWIVMVEESLERTPSTSAVVSDGKYLRSLEEMGHRYAVLDMKDPGVELYADQLNKGPPTTIVMKRDGKLLGWGRTPASTEAMNKLLRKYRGLK